MRRSAALSAGLARQDRRQLARFYAGFLLPLLAAFLLLKGSELLLLRAGEYLSPDEIIDRLDQTHGVYGAALGDRSEDFKRRLYLRRRPQAAAIGSSRVMQFRQEDFSVPFVNLGSGALASVTERSKALFVQYKPGLVILGVDIWWFQGDGESMAVAAPSAAPQLTMSDRFMPVTWLLSGKLGFGDIARILSGASPDVGITGIVRGDGYAADGSYHDVGKSLGKWPPDDFRFEATKKKIEAGTKNYATAGGLSETQWASFRALLDFYRAQGLDVVMFLPPLAPTTLEAMAKSGHYNYVDELRRRLPALAASYGMRYFDYHDMRPLGAVDCEFLDGHHGGPVVFKRLLLDMAAQDPSLGKIENTAEIQASIKTYAGHAATIDGPQKDFLGIGCAK